MSPRTSARDRAAEISDGVRLRHVAPAKALAPFVEHHVELDWDLREPRLHESPPHPAVHLVFEPRRSRVHGTVSGRYARRLVGKGWLLAVRLRPGAFHAFARAPVRDYTDRMLGLARVFGPDGPKLARAITTCEERGERIAKIETFLHARGPVLDEGAARAGKLVERVAVDSDVTRAEQLAAVARCTPQALGAMFDRYIGVSPKQVIQRYRLHEAVERVAEGVFVDWNDLAARLGYRDQARFIDDFRALLHARAAGNAA